MLEYKNDSFFVSFHLAISAVKFVCAYRFPVRNPQPFLLEEFIITQWT